MTHNDYTAYAKLFGIMLIVSIPVLIAVNFLLNKLVSMTVLIILDTALLIAGFCIAVVIKEKHKANIAKKREEFLAKQKTEKNEKKTKGE